MLYLVRHGRTEANEKGLIQGRLDQPIDEVGAREARAMADHVLKISGGVDEVWCSPLLRARQSAEFFGVEPQVDARWIEVAYGEYEGVPAQQVASDVWKAWVTDRDYAPAGGESFFDLRDRVVEACEEIFERASARDVVVVTHVSPIKAAVAWTLKTSLDIMFNSHLSHSSLCRIAPGWFGPTLYGFNETIAVEGGC